MKSIYTITRDLCESDITLNRAYILISCENVNTGDETWHLYEDNGEGVPGNMDASIKRYHGWRGTTNNISVYAHGLRRVLEIRSERDGADFSRLIRVKLGPDEAPDDM